MLDAVLVHAPVWDHALGCDGPWGVGGAVSVGEGELERGERGRDCGRGGVVQMWKGEDGIGVASSVEDDHDDDDMLALSRSVVTERR